MISRFLIFAENIQQLVSAQNSKPRSCVVIISSILNIAAMGFFTLTLSLFFTRKLKLRHFCLRSCSTHDSFITCSGHSCSFIWILR